MNEQIRMSAQKRTLPQTKPANRPTAPNQSKKRKHRKIIYKTVRIFKRIRWGRITILLLSILGVIYLFSLVFVPDALPDDTGITEEPAAILPTPEYVFRTGDGSPVDVQGMTNAWAAEAGFLKRYELTDAERWEVASVVTAEAGGEPFAGMMAVAQCILQACEDDGIRPCEAVVAYKYAKSRPEPTKEALEAVQAVFDFGQVATHKPIKYFYAPALVYSEFHESQNYALTINNHKFFTEAKR